MEFRCEDLRDFGVTLVPPSSPDYEPLLADIRDRMERRVEGSPPVPDHARPQIADEDRETSAILVNGSRHGVAEIKQIRTFEVLDLRTGERRVTTSGHGPGMNSRVLLPFGVSEARRCLYGYWHVILPGSKRYMGPNGEMLGDNSDVRPPVGDEVWTGGVISWGSGRGGGTRPGMVVEAITLTLDGIFFTDGGFAGGNKRGLWEMITANGAAHAELLGIAREGIARRESPEEILRRIETVTGPSSDHPPIPHPAREKSSQDDWRTFAMQRLAWQIGRIRQGQSDDAAVAMIAAWAQTPVSSFYKL